MPDKKAKKSPKKSSKKPAKKSGGDFKLNPQYYDQMAEFEVYASENKITKIFGLRNKSDETSEPYVKIRTRSKTPRGWKFIYGMDLHSDHLARFIHGLLSIAWKLGWKVRPSDDIEVLKSRLRESEESIVGLEKMNREWRAKHEQLMRAFRAKQEEVLKSRTKEFERDVSDLEQKLAQFARGKVAEQEMQQFLYDHPWFFGTEYVNAEPQKLRGAHSRFDFYLERFNKTNDIVEIKLPSDNIVNSDGSLTAKVSQAVDQLIEYMESSQAAAHSRVIGDEEGIKELRPRGIVIIGSDTSKAAREKLMKWNYQFSNITIMTYSDVLDRARSVLDHLRKKGTDA